MDDLPLSPEQWRAVVQSAATTTGHGDEVMVKAESTMSGWQVVVHPVPATEADTAPSTAPDSL